MSKFLRWLHWGYGGSHFDSRNFWLLPSIYAWGARVVQWWGHSPLTRVARVGILVLVLYVCWGYCWFCPMLCEVFLCVFQFSPLLKYQHYQILIRSRMHGHISVKSEELVSAPWVNKIPKVTKKIQFVFKIKKEGGCKLYSQIFRELSKNNSWQSVFFWLAKCSAGLFLWLKWQNQSPTLIVV